MKLTPQQMAWLKGLEKFVGAAVITAVFENLKAGGFPSDRAGWLKFASVAGVAGYAAVRLYLQASPLANLPTAAPPQVINVLTSAPPAPPRSTTV